MFDGQSPALVSLRPGGFESDIIGQMAKMKIYLTTQELISYKRKVCRKSLQPTLIVFVDELVVAREFCLARLDSQIQSKRSFLV